MKLLKKTFSIILATSLIATPLLSVKAAENLQPNSNLPEYYSSADHGYVTPVKHQGETAACWSYATIAACESSMIINNGYDTSLDLSELHLAYAAYHNQTDKMGMFDGTQTVPDYVYHGNNIDNVFFTLANQQGVVKESVNHGQFSSEKLLFDYASNFDVQNPESLYAFNEAYVSNVYRINTSDRNLLKEHIIKYGAGTIEIYMDDEYYNEETGTYFYYDHTSSRTTHVVAVVGWDDNYAKENCTVNGHTPEENGAWLIKNSYGTELGINGYNWVSYEDFAITRFPAVFYQLSPSDTYTNTYQYDDLSMQAFFQDENFTDSFTGGAYMANMFTAQKDNETLEAVSFYTSNELLDYNVEIYTNVQDIANPTNGTLKATVSGEDLLMGYHTIQLPKSVSLNKGEKFSVVVNIKDNQDTSRGVHVNIDSGLFTNDVVLTKNSAYGESFFSKNGKSWVDIKDSVNGNMRIKAFTNSDDTPLELEDHYNYAEGKTRKEIITEFETVLEKCHSVFEKHYEYSFDTNFLAMWSVYSYAVQAYDKSDIFLSPELNKLINSLNFYHSQLKANDIINNVSYYDTIPQWNELIDELNTIFEEAKNTHLNRYAMIQYSNQADEAYSNYIPHVIAHGAYDSYLQNFGDADNDGEINIKDATTIQMFIAKINEYDLYNYYNSDVNGDGNVNIMDATAIQKYLSNLIEYMPVYDKQIGNEETDKNIDLNTAIANLETAVNYVNDSSFWDYLSYNNGAEYLLVEYQHYDASEVLDNPQNYHPNVINFKAQCLNYNLDSILSNIL